MFNKIIPNPRWDFLEIHPLPYKRTGDISVSPVHQKTFLAVQFFGQKFVARPVFPLCFSLKNIARPNKHQQIVARPVLLQNWSPVLLYGRGVINIWNFYGHFMEIKEKVFFNFWIIRILSNFLRFSTKKSTIWNCQEFLLNFDVCFQFWDFQEIL